MPFAISALWRWGSVPQGAGAVPMYGACIMWTIDALLRDGMARLVKHGLDSLKRHLPRIEADLNRFRGNVGAYRFNTGQNADSPIHGFHAVRAAHAGHRQHCLRYLTHNRTLLLDAQLGASVSVDAWQTRPARFANTDASVAPNRHTVWPDARPLETAER